ncbi:MAG: hypothetical protein MUD01_29325 [Chloroflexaceae bacterium]|jgi:hypothetical protein|nr:hypothetical protein [Chloroflexaceae bacterium]
MKALTTKFTIWTIAGLTATALLSACGAAPQASAPTAAPAAPAATAAPAPAATAAPAPAASANASEAQAVVERFVATLNAGDQPGLRAMFTPTGQVSYGGSNPMQGQAIDGWLQSDIFGV